jgi:hypothetical protein
MGWIVNCGTMFFGIGVLVAGTAVTILTVIQGQAK